MELTVMIVAGVLALAFVGAGIAKLMGAERIVTELGALGVGSGLQQTIGSLEVLGAAGLIVDIVVVAQGLPGEPLLAWIGPAAGIGLATLTGLAVREHLRAGQTMKEAGGAATLAVLALVYVALRLAL